MENFNLKEFLDPPSYFYPGYFWVINDKLDAKKIKRQIHDMFEKKAKSVCFLPEPHEFRPLTFNTMFDVVYLGKKYFEIVRKAVKEADKLGMNWWLYDEGGWPSGGACGQVYGRNPSRFGKKCLTYIDIPVGKDMEYEVPEGVICASIKKNGKWKVYFKGEKIKGLDEDTKLRIFFIRDIPEAPGQGAFQPDILNREVTGTFINLTHERYRKYLGEFFGKTMLFTFTDEPATAYPSRRSLPWTYNFEKIFYGLSMLLAFVAPVSWKAYRLLLILIITTKIIQFDYKNFLSKIRSSKFLIALLSFLFYQFITFLWTETSYHDSHEFIRGYFLWFAIPILALSIKILHIRNIITAYLLAMAISEVIAYGMYFGFWTINGHGSDYPSPFMHHTSYSIFMAFTAIILLNRIYSHLYTNKEKIIMAIFFVTVTGNLFISQGRIGQLALALAIFIAGILHFKLKLKTLLISIFTISAIFFTAYHISPMFQKRVYMASNDIKKIKEGNLDSSWGIRIAYLMMGSDIIREQPIFGVGIEDTKAVALEYIKENPRHFPDGVINFMKRSHHFHNQYLMTTLQGGIVGLILFIIMFYYLLTLPIADQELKRLSILFTSIFLVAFISDPFMMYDETRALFILFVVLFVAASIPDKYKVTP